MDVCMGLADSRTVPCLALSCLALQRPSRMPSVRNQNKQIRETPPALLPFGALPVSFPQCLEVERKPLLRNPPARLFLLDVLIAEAPPFDMHIVSSHFTFSLQRGVSVLSAECIYS